MSIYAKRVTPDDPNRYAVLEQVEIAAGPNMDKFGRLRVSDGGGNRFDFDPVYGTVDELLDEVTSGASSISFDSDARDHVLTIGDTTVNDLAAIYGYDVPYTAGSSQLVDITGTMNGAALEGAEAFLFLRSGVSGSVVTTTYAQADWNINAVADMDWSKSQILIMDFQSLRVGSVGFAFSRDGAITPVHQIDNDNRRATGYWQTPHLPPYWRIYNDATHTYTEMGYGDANNGIGLMVRVPVNATATMRSICTTVKSEAGASLFELPGFNRSADNGVTPVTVSTTLVPVLSIRVAATLNSIANRGLYIPNSFGIQTNNPIRYVILYRPTLTGASFTAVDATYSGMEYDVSATAVTGGIVVASGYVATDRNSAGGASGLLGRTLMRLTRTGTPDILTLAAIRTSSSDGATLAAIGWRELR